MDQTPQSAGNQPPPTPAQVVPQPPPQPPRKRFPWARLVAVLLASVLVFSLLANVMLLGIVGLTCGESEPRVQEKFFSHQKDATDKVAILSIEGAILAGEGFFKRQIDRAIKEAKEGHLKAVVVRVNSPGGTMTGSDYMYHHLCRLKEETGIPLVVSMGAMAASGGYYVSMAVGDTRRAIFAEPTTWTGSIGVIIPHYDISELLKTYGVRQDSIVSRPLKGMGSMTRPMTEEERGIFKELVDQAFNRFKTVIKEGRPRLKEGPKSLEDLATGQVFTADQAKEYKLIDEIGFIEDAVDRAIELAGLDRNNVCVVKYKPEPTLASILLGVGSRSQPALDLSALLEATAPRAYYLCTWLPPIVSSAKP